MNICMENNISYFIMNNEFIEIDPQEQYLTNYNEEFAFIISELEAINDIQKEFNDILHIHGEKLTHVNNNLVITDQENVISNNNIIDSYKSKHKYLPIIGGSLIGLSIGGPFGLLLGLKIGAICTGIGGIIIGGTTGKFIKKFNFLHSRI